VITYHGVKATAANEFGAFVTAEGIKMLKWMRFLPL
jgi:hypothetical protein